MSHAALTVLKNSTNVRLKRGAARTTSAPTWLRAAFRLSGLLAPGLGAAAAEKLFLTPGRYDPPESELKLLATGHYAEIPYSGGHLASWSWGDGPTVYLLHGWEGRAGQFAPLIGPLLEAGFSVVAFDAPAHGRSAGDRSSMIDFSRALTAAIAWGGPAHAVVGHSVGGAATMLATLRGARPGRVVTIGAPIGVRGYERAFREYLALPESVTRRLRARVERRYATSWDELRLEERVIALGDIPALIVHDRDDREVPLSAGQSLASAWPGARLLVTEGLGHRKILRDEALAREIVAFLKGERA